jgi:pilus assembly protein CpaE
VALVDADLQFGDHRVFLDMTPDHRSLVDAVMAPSIDSDLLRHLVEHHESGVDLMLAPSRPEMAEHFLAERQPMKHIVESLRSMYDYVIVDLDKRLDDHTLDIIAEADVLFVVLTADLSCIKNVRLVLETMAQIGVPDDKVQLLMNRSNAFTGISAQQVEAVLRRPVTYQVVNDYRIAISALNSGDPFMQNRADSVLGRSLMEFVQAIDTRPVSRPVAEPTLTPRRMVPALTG